MEIQTEKNQCKRCGRRFYYDTAKDNLKILTCKECGMLLHCCESCSHEDCEMNNCCSDECHHKNLGKNNIKKIIKFFTNNPKLYDVYCEAEDYIDCQIKNEMLGKK